MSAYTGKSKRIKNAVVAILTAITYDTGSGSEAAFAQVLDNPRNIFDGWPNAQVLPGGLRTDRATTDEMDKTPAYIIRIRIPLESLKNTADTRTPDERQSAAVDQMYDLTDLVVDAIADADKASSLNDGAGTIAITMTDTKQGDWRVVSAGDGSVLMADIDLTVAYSRDLQ